MAGAPVQIVTIEVNPPSLRKGESWRAIPPRRSHWTIRVHERIDTVGQYGKDRSASAVRRMKADVAERPEDIKSDENLFDEDGLALDSIDALELGVNIQKKYGVKIDPQDKNLSAHFQSVRALADFINRK